ncbi:MAG: hypothetical protein KJ666_11445 [Bacteroidetes bacterium]|nr:hypothetical protein [Bacteroidota bacterium]MBU2585772.1 hypothetical protein [Bacteroidota bacterium]
MNPAYCGTKKLQIALGKLRLTTGHYAQEGLLAFDPHRIHSYSRRIMPAKKKDRESKSEKILQTFFCIDAITGQPSRKLSGWLIMQHYQ